MLSSHEYACSTVVNTNHHAIDIYAKLLLMCLQSLVILSVFNRLLNFCPSILSIIRMRYILTCVHDNMWMIYSWHWHITHLLVFVALQVLWTRVVVTFSYTQTQISLDGSFCMRLSLVIWLHVDIATTASYVFLTALMTCHVVQLSLANSHKEVWYIVNDTVSECVYFILCALWLLFYIFRRIWPATNLKSRV